MNALIYTLVAIDVAITLVIAYEIRRLGLKGFLHNVYDFFGGDNPAIWFYLQETVTLREWRAFLRDQRENWQHYTMVDIAFEYAGGHPLKPMGMVPTFENEHVSLYVPRPKMEPSPILEWATARMEMSFNRFRALNTMWVVYAGRG